MNGDFIPHSKPFIDDDDIRSLIAAVNTGMLGMGQETVNLEKKLELFIGKPTACISSGTAALHLLFYSLGISNGSKVAIPTHCCPSIFYVLKYLNAKIYLYDSGSLGIDADMDSLGEIIDLVDLIVIVHQYGFPSINALNLVNRKNFIEDCAVSIGAKALNNAVGSFGIGAIFSFYATKMLAGGEIGAISSCHEIIQTVKNIRTVRGADNDQIHFPYACSDMSASITLSQMDKLNDFIQRRTDIATQYTESFKNFPITLPEVSSQTIPVYFRYPIQTDFAREVLFRKAYKKNIQLGYGVKTPIHHLIKLKSRNFPNSDRAYRNSVSIPIYPALSQTEVERIIDFVIGLFK